MKRILSLILVTNLLVLVSCGPKQEEHVNEFAVIFGDFVNTNQKDSVQKYYPDFELVDSLANIEMGNLTVLPAEENDTYQINYTPEKTY